MADTTIGNIPDSLPNFEDAVLLETEYNIGLGNQGFKATALQMFEYIADTKFQYGNGITFDSPSDTISLDINLTNLKFDLNLLNTIQDIDINASPLFEGLHLNDDNGPLLLMVTSVFGQPNVCMRRQVPSTVNPTAIGRWDAEGQTNLGNQWTYAGIGFDVSDISDVNPAGSINFFIQDGGFAVLNNYMSIDGSINSINHFVRLQNLIGYQSFQESLMITSSANVDSTIIGRTVFNETASTYTLTLTLNDINGDGSTFDMIRSGSGDFILQADVGVTLNGADGGSFVLNSPYERIRVTKIDTNEYTFSGYSIGGSGSGDWQAVYNTSIGNQSFIQSDSEPLEIRNSLGSIVYSFGSDISSNTNLFSLTNPVGDIDVTKSNLSAPTAQKISSEQDIALNDISSQFTFIQKIASVKNSGVGLEAGEYVILVQDPALGTLTTYFELDGENRTARVPNNTTKILDPIATISDVVSVSLQDAYDAGNTIQLNGSDDIVISGPGPVEMFRFDNSLINISLVPMRVEDILTIQSDSLVSPGNLSIEMTPIPSASDIIGDITFDGLDSVSSGVQYVKIEGSVGDPLIGSRSSLMSIYAYFNDSQQSILVYDGTDNSTKIRDPLTGLLEQISTSGDVDLQDAYNNGDGTITMVSGKPLRLISTDTGLVLNTMTSVQGDAIINPENGLMFWNIDLNRIRVNTGSAITPLFDDVAYLSDVNATLSSNYGEMYFFGNTTDETIIVAPATPVKIVGTYVSGLLDNWSQSAGTLTWTGLDTKVFKISATVSLTPNLTTDTFTVFLAKNGNVISKSQQSVFFGPTVPSPTSVTVQSTESFDSLDTLEVYVQNDTQTNNVTVVSINCSTTDQTGTFDTGNVTLQTAYTNGNGQINTVTNKHFVLNGTDAAFLPNRMLSTEFSAITSQQKGLIAFAEDQDRYIVNKGTNLSPVYDNLAYVSDVTGGTLVSSGNPNMTIQNETGINGTVILSQWYQKIENVVYVKAELTGMITSTSSGFNLNIPFTSNFTLNSQANGVGSCYPTLGNAYITPQVESLAICSTPKTGYSTGIGVSVVTTYYGSDLVPANTLQIGDQLRFSVVGKTTGSGTGSLNLIFGPGPAFAGTPTFSRSTSGDGNWKLDYQITILAGNTARVSAVGSRSRNDSSLDNLDFVISPNVIPFNPAVDNRMAVFYVMLSGNYELIANQVSITKISSPTNINSSSKLRYVDAIITTPRVSVNLSASPQNLNKTHRILVDFAYEIQP